MLTRDAAVHALVEARLDLSAIPGSRDLDVDALLAWSRVSGAAARFAGLAAAVRDGLTAWLRLNIGGAARVTLALVEAGRGEDAMALGVVAAVLTGSGRAPEAALAVGGLFAGAPRAGLDRFAVGLDRFAGALDDQIAAVGKGGSAFHAIRGEYGSGKTFFARWLAEHAKRAGLATAEALIAWLGGQRSVAASARRAAGVRGGLDHFGALDPRFDSPRAVQLRLAGFDLPELGELGRNVRDLYAAGASARVPAKVDDAYLDDLAAAVTGGLGGKAGVAPRVFLRKLVADVLDRVDEFPDFDPRRDYALTVSSHELTEAERNAAGDVHLDLR